MALYNKDIMIRYLLGDLPEEDLERLAEEYFGKDEAWQALGAVESDDHEALGRITLHRIDLAAAGGFVLNGHHRRLIQNDATLTHVDQCVGRAKID